MFVRSYVDLDVPFQEAEASLLGDPEAWVPGLLRDAEGRGHALLAEVGFEVDQRRIDREVEISLGMPYRSGTATRVPLTWRATAGTRLFPQLEGDIEVAALGPNRSQLSMDGRYRPPLALVGHALDRALLHRVAEATIGDFVGRIAERITARRAAVR
ncbi:MAG TPA: hypothetical protein VKC55_05965 [Actinomycetota bacterium]|jgi:hypothetical protein|nr:hypothetical protein [Actinomycetota bacterium]